MDESDTMIGFELGPRKYKEQMKSFERVNIDFFKMVNFPWSFYFLRVCFFKTTTKEPAFPIHHSK